MKQQPKLLLFDLGGVLLRLNSPAQTFDLQVSEDAFLKQWIHSPAVREFERGSIDAAAFADQITAEFELPYSSAEFLQRFAAWPDQLFSGIPELLGGIPPSCQTALLSNTNALHWQDTDAAALLTECLDRTFLSYITGLLKPDAAAFEHACAAFSCTRNEIVFFDDNPENIEAAIRYGLNAYLTRGVDELRTHLVETGIIN